MSKSIHLVLEEILREKDISIAEAARVCDLPDSTVRGIITRKQKSVALEVAFKLSAGLGVSLEYLNGMDEKSPAPSEDNAGNITIEESNRLLVALGYIKPGQELSDRDLEFLGGIIQLLDSWFNKSE